MVREEPVCWLQLEGCTHWSTTGDHVIPYSVRPDLAMRRANVRGACAGCNHKRGDLPVEALVLGTDQAPALDIFD